MFFILGWIIYGLIVGLIAKALHPGKEAAGFLPTILIGVAGSYIGGLINWALVLGEGPFSPSGIFMGILGGVVFCWLYNKYSFDKLLK